MRMAKINAQYLATLEYEAEHMRDNRWVVRPKGQLGTMGFHPVPWDAQFVKAHSSAEALRKAALFRR